MQIVKATGLDRKSGGAQWRDLCVDTLTWIFFVKRAEAPFGNLTRTFRFLLAERLQ
jgi:hypothetical protein